ncbi:MAG TPA: hypothetical protein VFI70_11295 [Nitrososphaeraceae archaeon]|nr:hypothetical protein [Nitrososphaeraceae archaeon]
MTIIDKVSHAIIVEGSRQASGHNPETAGSAVAVTITKITGTHKLYGCTFYLVCSVSSQFHYNHEEVVPHPFSFPSHINDGSWNVQTTLGSAGFGTSVFIKLYL